MSINAKRKLNIFLCHSSQDKPIVRELYHRLTSKEWLDVWLDEEKLLPGQDWDMEIEKAVETANAVIVCLSKNSVSKEGYIQRELRFVLDIALEKPEGTIFIIPLRLDNCEPPRRLKAWQYADYFPEAYKDVSFAHLIASLTSRATSIGIFKSVEPARKNSKKQITKTAALSLGEIKSQGSLRYSNVQNELLGAEALSNKKLKNRRVS